MTQGFPPGQQPPQGYGQAVPPQYQQPYPQQYQQQPQTQAAYPADGYPQPGAQTPKKESGSRGWLVALGVLTLILPVSVLVSDFVVHAMDLDWRGIVSMLARSLRGLILPLAGVAVMFRSAVARWVLAGASALLIVLMLVDLPIGADGMLWTILLFMQPLAVLVLAFLPPVNRAFRNSSSDVGQGPVGYAAQVAYPAYPGQPQQQAQYPQAGYANQQWQ